MYEAFNARTGNTVAVFASAWEARMFCDLMLSHGLPYDYDEAIPENVQKISDLMTGKVDTPTALG